MPMRGLLVSKASTWGYRACCCRPACGQPRSLVNITHSILELLTARIDPDPIKTVVDSLLARTHNLAVGLHLFRMWLVDVIK
jgi:hypothetical protein